MSRKSAKKKPAGDAPSLISDAKLKQLYATMLKCRMLDAHARNSPRERSWKGKEAAIVGAAMDLRPEDAIVFSSNAAIASFVKGAPLRSIFALSNSRSSSETKKRQKTAATAGAQAQCAVATGIAYARSAGKDESVTVAFLSANPEELATERDALQFASIQKLPIIYVYCGGLAENAERTSYGFPIIPVDGNDVVAVYRVAHECIVRAREGGGPSVIACDLASGAGSAKSHDPLRNMERYLSAKGLFKPEWKQSTIGAFEKAISAAKKAARQQKKEQQSPHIFVV